MKKVLIIILFISGVLIDIYYPLLDIILLAGELIFIVILLNKLDMKKYKEIYRTMDKFEKKLVHKLLGLLLACLLIPFGMLIWEIISFTKSIF